jgi:hypothetical protein
MDYERAAHTKQTLGMDTQAKNYVATTVNYERMTVFFWSHTSRQIVQGNAPPVQRAAEAHYYQEANIKCANIAQRPTTDSDQRRSARPQAQYPRHHGPNGFLHEIMEQPRAMTGDGTLNDGITTAYMTSKRDMTNRKNSWHHLEQLANDCVLPTAHPANNPRMPAKDG